MKSCNDIYQEFVKRHGRLENAHNSIQQRIEQCSRLSDGVSRLFVEKSTDRILTDWLRSHPLLVSSKTRTLAC